MNKYLLSGLIILSVFFSSCNTLKQSGVDYNPIDYTLNDVKESEIKRINEMLESSPVEALWRATLIGNSDTLKNAKDVLVKKIQKELEEKDYFNALKDFYSLKTVDSEYIKNVGIPEKDLIALSSFEIPGFKAQKEKLPQSLNDCIDATVTIWVDKGISIKNGIGYADRVLGSGFLSIRTAISLPIIM